MCDSPLCGVGNNSFLLFNGTLCGAKFSLSTFLIVKILASFRHFGADHSLEAISSCFIFSVVENNKVITGNCGVASSIGGGVIILFSLLEKW